MLVTHSECRDRYCVVGTGPSGLAAIKNLAQAGIAVEAFEREDDVGGNWYYGRPSSSVCASTHLISSKRNTEYIDYPMPKSYPPFPSHQQALAYLRGYAEHFDLYRYIQLGTSVSRIEPAEENRWRVTLDDGSPPREYAGVVIANGHHWDPHTPKLAGEFHGESMHSREYKTHEVLRGRRVLVIGAGNSGCDIAAEAAQHAQECYLSMRRGYHFMPKFLWGGPIDSGNEVFLRWHMPLWMRRMVGQALLRLAVGPVEKYGLPKPDHKLFETHPIINSQVLYYMGHGEITPKPDVAELAGNAVKFADGSEAPIDLIVYATGFHISFPFIDREHLNWREGCPRLFLNVFHPTHENLFVAGLIQPDSGLWGLADWQCRLIARYITAQRTGSPAAAWLRGLTARAQEDHGDGIRYVRSPRHLLEVEHFSYRRRLMRLVRKMDRALAAGGARVASTTLAESAG